MNPVTIVTKKHSKRFLLDECLQITNKKLRTKFGYVNATELVKEGTSDDKLLQKAIKENLVIITRDIRFALKAVLLGVEIIFHDSNHTRTLIPKNKPQIIEYNCVSQKYRDELAYYTMTFDEVVIP
ncbi:MAG: hypothetical protein COA77_06630 [Thaumarchaeota archaeon]|nr:MAG: hypothetical protein COA77_06630 [Nitrososphaerota archaeon]